MNAEKYLEAMVALPLNTSLESVLSLAQSSNRKQGEDFLSYLVIALAQRGQVPPEKEEIRLLLFKVLEESLPLETNRLKLVRSCLFYADFLRFGIHNIYAIYRHNRTEHLLKVCKWEELVECRDAEVPEYLASVERSHVQGYLEKAKADGFDDTFLLTTFEAFRTKHVQEFINRNLFLILMWASVALSAFVALFLSMSSSSGSLIDVIFGWLDFAKTYFN